MLPMTVPTGCTTAATARCGGPRTAAAVDRSLPTRPPPPAHPPAACPAGGVVTDPGDAGLPRRLVAWLGDEHLLQGLELLHALAGADGDRVQRVVGDVDRHAGFVAEPLIEPAEQGAPAGEHDAPVHHVASQLRRALVQRRLDRVHDRVDRLLDGLADLLRTDDDRLGEAADQVASANLGMRLIGQWEG